MRHSYIRSTRRGLAVALAMQMLLLTLVLRPTATFGQTGFNYGDALQKAVWFFDANKCGPNVAADNVFSWRGACHTTDGSQASPALDLHLKPA